MHSDRRAAISSENVKNKSGPRHASVLNNILFLKIFSVSVFLLGMLEAHALNEAAQTYTVDGKLFQVGGAASLIDNAVKLTVQVIDPTGKCLLYEEQQTVNTSASDGYFSIHVGSATGSTKRTVSDPGRTMNQIFQNMNGIVANNVPGQTCTGGVYTPAAGAVRYFRIIVTPSATNVADTLTPDIVLDSVPTALVSQSVQGLERAGILQVNNSGSTVLTQNNLEALFTTPAYANLQSILAGNFMTIDASGATLPSYAANPAGVANGDIWFDTVTNEVKYKNAAGVQVVGSGGGGGISSLTVGSSMSINGTVAGTISSAGTIDLTNTGVTAGTYTKMTVDAKGRVTAGTISLVEGDIPNLTIAGKVSGNTITAGTISGSAGINSSGNLITTATVSGLTVQATNLRIYNGSNYIQIVSPTLAGIVNFTLPDTDGDPGEVLTTNGSGVLSWASGTTTLAGDVSGPSGTTSVDKIKGKAITAGSVSGQIMIYDGTAWGNSVMSGDATLAHDGMLTLNKVPVSKGGTNAITFGNNKMISSNGTGSALQDFSCSLNQVITFDTSGYAVCANVSSLSAAILNGGNTTAADISVGTNDNYALNFKVNNTVAMTISQSGNVGIGTIAPTAQLHIVGANSSSGSALANALTIVGAGNTGAGAGAGIGLTGGTSTGGTGGSVVLTGGNSGASLTLAGGAWANSGSVTLAAGTNGGNGAGAVNIYGADGFSYGKPGGPINITGGSTTDATGTAGAISIAGGSAFNGNVNGAAVNITGGAGFGTGVAGHVLLAETRGNVGIGVSAPTAKLEVQGQVVSKVYNNGAATTFDFSNGNSQYTSASCGAMILQNMIDGGSYTIAVQGATSGTCTFTDSAGGRTFKFAPANAATTAATHSIYSMQVMGSYVYVAWITGF